MATNALATTADAPGGDVMATIENEARADATRILRTLWVRDDDETPLPVDPVRIARALGIAVRVPALDDGVAAVLAKDPGEDPVILLDDGDSTNRKRYACAHALGHFVRRKADPDAYEYVDRRDAMASPGDDTEELYANAFADALLMPAADLRRVARSLRHEVELAWRFDVSREAMHYRLLRLGLAGAR